MWLFDNLFLDTNTPMAINTNGTKMDDSVKAVSEEAVHPADPVPEVLSVVENDIKNPSNDGKTVSISSASFPDIPLSFDIGGLDFSNDSSVSDIVSPVSEALEPTEVADVSFVPEVNEVEIAADQNIIADDASIQWMNDSEKEQYSSRLREKLAELVSGLKELSNDENAELAKAKKQKEIELCELQIRQLEEKHMRQVQEIERKKEKIHEQMASIWEKRRYIQQVADKFERELGIVSS